MQEGSHRPVLVVVQVDPRQIAVEVGGQDLGVAVGAEGGEGEE
jgi:hypothetical protein